MTLVIGTASSKQPERARYMLLRLMHCPVVGVLTRTLGFVLGFNCRCIFLLVSIVSLFCCFAVFWWLRAAAAGLPFVAAACCIAGNELQMPKRARARAVLVMAVACGCGGRAQGNLLP